MGKGWATYPATAINHWRSVSLVGVNSQPSFALPLTRTRPQAEDLGCCTSCATPGLQPEREPATARTHRKLPGPRLPSSPDVLCYLPIPSLSATATCERGPGGEVSFLGLQCLSCLPLPTNCSVAAAHPWEEGQQLNRNIIQPVGKDQGPSSLTVGSREGPWAASIPAAAKGRCSR